MTSSTAQSCPISREQLEALTLRIRLEKRSGDKIAVNLPMSVIRLCAEQRISLPPLGKSGKLLQEVDLKQILCQVEEGKTGRLLQLQSVGGDELELVVE